MSKYSDYLSAHGAHIKDAANVEFILKVLDQITPPVPTSFPTTITHNNTNVVLQPGWYKVTCKGCGGQGGQGGTPESGYRGGSSGEWTSISEVRGRNGNDGPAAFCAIHNSFQNILISASGGSGGAGTATTNGEYGKDGGLTVATFYLQVASTAVIRAYDSGSGAARCVDSLLQYPYNGYTESGLTTGGGGIGSAGGNKNALGASRNNGSVIITKA